MLSLTVLSLDRWVIWAAACRADHKGKSASKGPLSSQTTAIIQVGDEGELNFLIPLPT